MPTYTTHCETCKKKHNTRLSFTDYDAVMLGTKMLECSTCHNVVSLVFDPGDVKFVLKDGESGGWVSKSMRENKYRLARQNVMERRQREHAPNPKLVPNFAGEQTETWADARRAAFDKALSETQDITAAREASSTYDSLVKQETP